MKYAGIISTVVNDQFSTLLDELCEQEKYIDVLYFMNVRNCPKFSTRATGTDYFSVKNSEIINSVVNHQLFILLESYVNGEL